MLTSNVRISQFLDGLIEDMGLYTDRARDDYRNKMNEALVFLYAAVIRHRAVSEAVAVGGRLDYHDIPRATGADTVNRTDVLAVYHNGVQLRYLPPEELAGAAALPACYYTVDDHGILLSKTGADTPLRVVYIERCSCFFEESEDNFVPLPTEFLPMLAARVRGEIYRLENQDDLCAKWLSVYNAYLADFGDYLAARRQGL